MRQTAAGGERENWSRAAPSSGQDIKEGLSPNRYCCSRGKERLVWGHCGLPQFQKVHPKLKQTLSGSLGSTQKPFYAEVSPMEFNETYTQEIVMGLQPQKLIKNSHSSNSASLHKPTGWSWTVPRCPEDDEIYRPVIRITRRIQCRALALHYGSLT